MIAGLFQAALLGAALSHPGHLYISASNSNGGVEGVYSYRMTNGIPSTQPEGMVGSVLAGAPFALDVGSDGSLYLEDAQGVKVFAPSNLTGPPVRFMPLYAWFELAHDAAGDLFASTSIGSVLAYPPNATAISQPLAMTPGNPFGVQGLAVSPSGDLYDLTSPLDVYANPTTNPTVIRTACIRHEGFGLAISADGGLYVSTGTGVARYPASVQGCPAPQPGAFFRTGGIGIGVVVAGGYLYAAASAFPNAPDFVDVFDVSDPRRPTLATITEPTLGQHINGIAVGP